MIEEPPQIIHRLRRVIVRPLKGIDYTEPFVARRDGPKSQQASPAVEMLEIGGDVCGDIDLCQLRDFAFPILIHERVLTEHCDGVFLAPQPALIVNLTIGETGLRDTARAYDMAVHVSPPLPGGDAGQVRWLFRRCEPLPNGQLRVA